MARNKNDDQKTYFLQYLSLAPVLTVVTISALGTLWAVINYFFPDILMFPNP